MIQLKKKTKPQKIALKKKGKSLIKRKPVKEEHFDVLFQNLKKADYEESNIKWIEPMLAKEPLNEKMLDDMLDSPEVVAEDKLDGVRCLIHIVDGHCRLFSRNVSKKSGWFTENSDNFPHLRDIPVPDGLGYTVIDGELKVNGMPFETISSMVNSLPEEAWNKQQVDGKASLNTFDILWYNGKCVQDEPLLKRKEYLHELLEKLDSKYLYECKYFNETIDVPFTPLLKQRYLGNCSGMFATYPLLYEQIRLHYSDQWDKVLHLNKREYYEYVVIHGGEGIMLKDPNGKYFNKRGREYTKYKKFLTRDVIVTSLTEPTKEYTGKELATWGYWIDSNTGKRMIYATSASEAHSYKVMGCIPVTKPYYYNWFGNAEFGVVIDDDDLAYLKKVNGKDFKKLTILNNWEDTGLSILIVGECAGFDDITKDEFTKDPTLICGRCIEVKCNEIFKKTGKMRHPRFMRVREDKNVEQCIFKDHIQSDGQMN